MRWLAVLLVIGLAGCVSPEGQDNLPEHVRLAEEACPLQIPESPPAPCDASWWTPQSDIPTIVEGWSCWASWEDVEGRIEMWSDRDGRVGFRWAWERWKPDGLAWQRFMLFTEPGSGITMDTEYALTGFVRMDEPFAQTGPVTADLHLVQARAFMQVDGAWGPTESVQFLVHQAGPDPWLTAVAHLDRDYVIDLARVREQLSDNPYRTAMQSFQGTLEGREIIISMQNTGAQFNTAVENYRDRYGTCGFETW